MTHHLIIRWALPLSLLLGSCTAAAQETREALVLRIASAQGLTELFEQQLAQQRASASSYAEKLFEQTLASSGGQANPKERAAFARFVENAADAFSGKEIAAAWVKEYGRNLTVAELKDILQYYESSIGQKDVAATKAAMPTFSAWMNQESQSRTTALLQRFVSDLQAAKD